MILPHGASGINLVAYVCRAAGLFENIVAQARALDSGGHRSPRSSQRALGLLARMTPVPRCLSLLARRRLRRAPAPDGTRFDPESTAGPHGSWLGSRGAFASRTSEQHVRDLMVAEARRGPVGSERVLLAPDGQALARQEAEWRDVGGASA